ncbi:MAG: hypothetical protein FWB71_03850 [Defluviitaleaceae bacterium]|nr:hypothetical protein [Defluviitaleaceae bacterium]
MGKKRIKPGQLRRVGGLALLSTGIGMVLVWAFPGLSLLLTLIFLALGFWMLFL